MHQARPSTLVLALVCCTSCAVADEAGESSSDGDTANVDDTDESSGAVDESGSDDTTSTSDATAETSEGDGPSSTSGAELSGEQIFTAFCSPCHGPDAGGTELAYEIRHPDREYARWIVRNGRMGTEFGDSVMMPFSEQLLTDDDLELVFDHLDSFPQPDTGEGLFLDYCRNCHGANAAGGVVGTELEAESLADALEQVREGEGGTDYGARTLYMSSFTATRLSDDEVAAILEYVATL